jgi:hypothetical protein
VKDLVRSIADALDKIPRPAPDSTLDSLPGHAENGEGEQDHHRSSAPVDRSAVATNKEEDS